MKRASIVVEPYYNQNRLFAVEDLSFNRDDCLYMFWALKNKLAEYGYDLQTADIHEPNQSDLVFFNDMPRDKRLLPKTELRSRSHLFLFESELIRPDNWDLALHQCFKTVFTWNDQLIAEQKAVGARYVKANFSHRIPPSGLSIGQVVDRNEFGKRRLCTLISGNKTVSHPLELYSERRKAIQWFERNAPEQFEYFGVGWDRPYLRGGFISKVMTKLKLIEKLPKIPSKCYGGKVDVKRTTLRQFRFSICFENAYGISGYITEKIFDSFFAGCVPVYKGALNILEHIPKECFINFDDFNSYEELYEYLNSMTETTWMQYLNCIEAFLAGPNVQPFSGKTWAETVVNSVTA